MSCRLVHSHTHPSCADPRLLSQRRPWRTGQQVGTYPRKSLCHSWSWSPFVELKVEKGMPGPGQSRIIYETPSFMQPLAQSCGKMLALFSRLYSVWEYQIWTNYHFWIFTMYHFPAHELILIQYNWFAHTRDLISATALLGCFITIPIITWGNWSTERLGTRPEAHSQNMTGAGTFCRDSAKEGLSPEDDFLIILTDLSHIPQFLASRIKFPSRIEPPGYPATIK